MTFISEFSYPDISQRRFILLNSLFSFIILGFLFIHSSLTLNYYFIFRPVLNIVFITGITGIFTGNLLGKLLFTRIKKFRLIYIFADIFFILSCLFYIYGRFIIPGSYNPAVNLFFMNRFYAILPIFAVSLFSGIKIRYFLKLTCGDFIDNKIVLTSFILLMITGIACGIGLSVFFYYYKELMLYSGILLLPVLLTIFIIKLSYNPTPIYAQEIKENTASVQEQIKNKRDDLLFIYLNFTYILIYIFLAFTCIVKFYGDFLHVKVYFIFLVMLSLSIGIIFANMLKQAFWYIYAEMIYPIFFIISLIFLILHKDGVSFYEGALIFIPLSIILGFSLFQISRHLSTSNNHKDRFNIINFSLFLLPFPIIVSLNFIEFTYFWYFVLLYVLAIINIFVPGIYLMQSGVKGYKKIIFFIFSLLFIPVIILFHLYFKIPLNSNLYINHTAGFDKLSNISDNSNYINNEASLYINGIKAFYADDNSLRNLKRSIFPVILYANAENNSDVLFIDGDRQFFKNPVISICKYASCLDYIPKELIDYNTLPISGEQYLTCDHSDILTYLSGIRSKYRIIADIPNLYDQSQNAYRFSKEYYNLMSSCLTSEGIFVQVLATSCRKDFIEMSAVSLKANFKNTIGFYFPGYLVFLSSDSDNSIKIRQANINNLKSVFDSHPDLKNLFYNEFHLLSHILFLKIDDFIYNSEKEKLNRFYFLERPKKFTLNEKLLTGFSENNSNFFELLDKSGANAFFNSLMQNQYSYNNYFLPGIKEIELFEANKDYENESAQLVKSRVQAEYKEDLRKYLINILSYKEDYYYNMALNFERDKKWEEARKLYKAILNINKNNFDANYRLGMLSIVLQDLDSAFFYLQYAMQLKKENPNVFYQMGILLISRGNPREALTYFEKAVELKEKTAPLLYYIGLCYEQMDNLPTALNYYNQAAGIDPNDKNIISGIERIKEKNNILQNEQKQDELNSQKNHTEVEQGEDIPFPVTESAKSVRIEENSNPASNKNKEQEQEKKKQ